MKNRISSNFEWPPRLDRLDDRAIARAADRFSYELAGIARGVIAAGFAIATGLFTVAIAIWLAFG